MAELSCIAPTWGKVHHNVKNRDEQRRTLVPFVSQGTKKIDNEIDSLFYSVAHLAMATARPIDFMSRVYRTHQLVYRCAKKSRYVHLANSKGSF